MVSKKTLDNPSIRAGQPTKFRPEMVDQVIKLCRLGAKDAELADFFGVAESTFHGWKRNHPDLVEALRDGKEQADANIANSLYHRALGYSHPDSHISNYQGDITITEITKHYPPDTAAAIIWLKNRRPDLWRDKVEVSGKLDMEFSDKLVKARERARSRTES